MAAQRLTDADKWRKQAHDALAQTAKVMQFFLHASAELVRLTEIHSPDDFTHCKACKSPWPCETMSIVQGIGAYWTQIQKETDG